MIDREQLIKELSVFIADKLLELSEDEDLPQLPRNSSHFERKLMELEESYYLLDYQASIGHGYRIQFNALPLEEQAEGVEGVYVLTLLRKEITTGRFTLAGEKRIFVFPSQVLDTIKDETQHLSHTAPGTYGLLDDDQFDMWN